VTVGVWVGNFSRDPLRGSSGVTGAGPIFHAVMLAAVQHARGHLPAAEDASLVSTPGDLRHVTICALSGMRANAWCPTRMTEWLPIDASPLPCSWHHQSDEGLLTIWPMQYEPWAKEHGMIRERAPVPSVVRTSMTSVAPTSCRFEIRNPPPGAIYLIDPTLRRDFQTLPLQAACVQREQIDWRIDDAAIGTTTGTDRLAWPLAVGEHRVTARDSRGRVAETTILVK
jgi:penicillin-binding protein 1C